MTDSKSGRRTISIKAMFDQLVRDNGHSPARAVELVDAWLRSGNAESAEPPLPSDWRVEQRGDDIALLAGDVVLDPAGFEIDNS